MKKQYRHQKKVADQSKPEPKIERVQERVLENILKEDLPKQSFLNKIVHDHSFPFLIILVILACAIIFFGIWINHYELEKNITLKVVTSSSGEFIVDECGDIYAYAPKGFGLIDIDDYYQADLIKYPNYNFPQTMKTLVNYHKIDKSEYIKNCSKIISI